MPIKDIKIFNLIESIGNHYKKNINNRFLRKAFMTMELDKTSLELIQNFTELTDYNKLQGYRFIELYERIFAMAQFINKARKDVFPNLKMLTGSGSSTVFSKSSTNIDNDKILRDMAVSNFESNLGVLSDMLNELYLETIEIDKKSHINKVPVYKRMPELKGIGQLLIKE